MNSTEKKIIKLGELTQKNEDKVVLCHGHFNVIHPGHIRYLRYAREKGNQLVVALVGDAPETQKAKFQFNQSERAEALALLSIADAIILLRANELNEAVRKLRPSMLVLGKEFENHQAYEINEAISLLRSQGKSVKFHAGDFHYANAYTFSFERHKNRLVS